MFETRHAFFACAAWLLCSTAAHASTTLQQDRAACTQEPVASRSACLREAGAAAQAAQTGQLTSLDAGTYRRNALARCDAFTAPQDKADCRARMSRQAIVQGSVDSGGDLRESVRTYTITR